MRTGASRPRRPQRFWLIADRSRDRSSRGGSRSWGRRACSEARTSPCRRPRSPRPPVAMLRWSEAAVSAPRPSSGVYVYGSSATPATLAGAALSRDRGVPGHPANAVGAERLERVEREDPLHLTERVPRALVRTWRLLRFCWSSEIWMGSSEARASRAERFLSSSSVLAARRSTSSVTSLWKVARARRNLR